MLCMFCVVIVPCVNTSGHDSIFRMMYWRINFLSNYMSHSCMTSNHLLETENLDYMCMCVSHRREDVRIFSIVNVFLVSRCLKICACLGILFPMK